MRNIQTSGALAAAALALATTAASTDSPFTGTWSGTWPSGSVSQLTVAEVKDRTAYGTYCNMLAPDHWVFVDLHQDAVHAKEKADTLRFAIGKRRYEFKPDGADALKLKHRQPNGKTRRITFTRVAEAGECSARIRPLDAEPAAETTPSSDSPWIGFWSGTTPKKRTVELNITGVADGSATGFYCDTRANIFTVSDLNPEAARAEVDDDELRFAAGKNDFTFSLHDDANALDMVNRRNKREYTLVLQRTAAADTACARRILPRS